MCEGEEGSKVTGCILLKLNEGVLVVTCGCICGVHHSVTRRDRIRRGGGSLTRADNILRRGSGNQTR